MHPLRRLGRFFVGACVLYTLLALPVTGLGRAYASAYRGVAAGVFGHFGSGGRVRFEPAPAGAPMDTIVIARNVRSPATASTPHSSRLTGFLPTVELIALVLASPVPWPRRWRALVAGWLLLDLFIGIRIAVMLVWYFNGHDPWSLWELGPRTSAVLRGSFEALVVSPTASYVLPVLLWLAVTFRREDVSALLGGKRARV